MRRANGLIERIADVNNLRLAFWKTIRGKRSQPNVLGFSANLNQRLCQLREDLLAGQTSWGPYHTFRIRDPKERMICAAPLRDRVAHHAIMNVAEPVFESYQIHDSYACRRGKGLDGSIARALQYCRAGECYLKLDVRRYFDSVDHGVLNRLLWRRFKDRRLLNLFESLVGSYRTAAGCGIPIGNLTSQFFANHYLGALDHFVKEKLRCSRYIRYMDDFVVWHRSRGTLRRIRDAVADFLDLQLRLQLKPDCINACSRGMTFLGYRVFPGHIRLGQASRKRFRRKLQRYHKNYSLGVWDEATTARHVEPLLAFVRRAESSEFRKRILKDLGLCPLA